MPRFYPRPSIIPFRGSEETNLHFHGWGHLAFIILRERELSSYPGRVSGNWLDGHCGFGARWWIKNLSGAEYASRVEQQINR